MRFMHRVDEIFTECPFYGSRRIQETLGREGDLCRKGAGAKMHEANGFAGDIPEEKPEQEASRPQDIPLSSQRQKNYAPQSSMGDRYNVHKASAGICVPCGGTGLV